MLLLMVRIRVRIRVVLLPVVFWLLVDEVMD